MAISFFPHGVLYIIFGIITMELAVSSRAQLFLVIWGTNSLIYLAVGLLDGSLLY